MNIQHKIKGALLGHLVGDARGLRQETLNQHPGVYTDRGSTMLCVASSINEMGCVDLPDIIECIRNFYVGGYLTPEGECFQISLATSQAIKNFNLGMPPDRCGVKGEDAIENDALARILPVALYHASSSTKELVDLTHDVIGLTHNNITNQVCGALYALLIRSLLLQKGEKVFDVLRVYYESDCPPDYENCLDGIKTWMKDKKPTGTTFVIDTFWGAWQAYAKHQDEFQHCMNACFKYGNRCGAAACYAGGLVGATVGVNEIPEAWIRELKIQGQAEDEINQFTRKTMQRIF